MARANHLRPGYLRRYLRDPGNPGQVRLDWLAILAGRDDAVIGRALASPPPGPRPRPAARRHDRALLFAEIRQDADQSGLSVRALADRHGVHRRTVRQALDSPAPAPRKLGPPRSSRLDPYKNAIDGVLRADAERRPQDRHTTRNIHQLLISEYRATGISYSTVRDYVAGRRPFLPPRTEALAGHPGHGQQEGENPPGRPSAAGDDCPLCAIAVGSGRDLIILRAWQHPRRPRPRGSSQPATARSSCSRPPT